MPYQLKPGVESFQVVDGPMAYTTFRKGDVYDKIPENERDKFMIVGTGSGAQGIEKNRKQKGSDNGDSLTPDPRPQTTKDNGGE